MTSCNTCKYFVAAIIDGDCPLCTIEHPPEPIYDPEGFCQEHRKMVKKSLIEPMKTNCLTCVHFEDRHDALYCGISDNSVDEFTSCTEDAYQFYGDEPDSFGEGENLLISIKIKDASFKSVTYGGGGFTLVTSEDEEIIIDTSHAAALASDSFKHTQDAIIRILRMINGL